MNLRISSDSDQAFKSIALKVYLDHRSEKYTEFHIMPVFEKELIGLLSTLANKSNKYTNLVWQLIPQGFHVRDFTIAKDDNDTECPYGDDDCDQDDFESMCDECKRDRGEVHAEGMAETFDL